MDPGPKSNGPKSKIKWAQVKNQKDPEVQNQMDPGPKSNGPGSKIKWTRVQNSVHTFFLGGGGDHCGDPPQTIAVGSHLRQSPRKKLWGVTSGSPPTAIVSGDSPQRVDVCHIV